MRVESGTFQSARIKAGGATPVMVAARFPRREQQNQTSAAQLSFGEASCAAGPLSLPRTEMNVAVLQHAALATILLSGRLSASDSLTNTLAVMHNQFAAASRSIKFCSKRQDLLILVVGWSGHIFRVRKTLLWQITCRARMPF